MSNIDNSQGILPCPFCQARVAIPLADILAGRPSLCNSCGAEFSVNHSESSDGLSKLRQWYQTVQRQVANVEQQGGEINSPSKPTPEQSLDHHPYQKRQRRPRRD
ncbi:hypothetical protein [Halioxenophilus sp. WMMB6]|uniref:hypothetical protein n=1 Tax=Halioxenophilus sp. WMMB6 TaxID=3073815 RepID=UPI00295E433A|nr:hypothetical protein [Halioxenophilus sp. WMMB6]